MNHTVRTADHDQRLGMRINRATFDGDAKIGPYQAREMTAPRPSIEETDARVNNKINDTFKSMAMRNIKNNSTTAAVSNRNRLNVRR